MNLTMLRIVGKINKVLKKNEDGSAIILFKVEPDEEELNSSIIMTKLSKKQWAMVKDIQIQNFSLYGQFDIRTQKNKPFIYFKCANIWEVKSKSLQKAQNKIDKFIGMELSDYQTEIKSLKAKIKKLESIGCVNYAKRFYKIRQKKLEDCLNKNWYEEIPKDEFKELDINNVRIVEEVHVNNILSIFNMKKLSQCEELTPIAVRKLENGDYGLVTGLRSFIICKLFSRNIKGYITDLSREDFKDKYSLEK